MQKETADLEALRKQEQTLQAEGETLSRRIGKEEAAVFYDREAIEHRYLKGYEHYDKRQIRKMTHLEKMDGKFVLFDYKNRDVLTNQAKVFYIDIERV